MKYGKFDRNTGYFGSFPIHELKVFVDTLGLSAFPSLRALRPEIVQVAQ